MTINAGQLSSRVTFRSRTASVDAAGQPVETWADVVTVWADVRAPKGVASAEQVAANAEASMTAYSVRIRRRTDISIGMRAVVGDALCDVAQVIDDVAGREYTDVVCVAGGVA